MPTKPLDRLMFAQGGLCFFCREPLPIADASVEHLLASANGGSNRPENCVACCKTVNALFGSMSLKEKFQAVLNQNGQFRCPGRAREPCPGAKPKPVTKPKPSAKRKNAATSSAADTAAMLARVVANLKGRGTSRPAKLKTLVSTVKSLLPAGASAGDLAWVVEKLQSDGTVSVTGEKVGYKF